MSGGGAGLCVAVLDSFPPVLNPVIRGALPAGWTASLATEPAGRDLTEVVRDADVVWAGATPTTRAILEAGPRIRFLQKLGAGFDNVDLETCRERGIAVARLAGVNGETVAEHAVMLLLAVYRRLPAIDRRVRAGEWFKEEARGVHREIRRKTVGIVGMGYAGRALARLLNAFGATVVYSDPVRAAPEVETELELRYVDLDELMRESDVISLHAPLTPETEKMIDARRIALMKPTAVLINCARGGLVDQPALEEALRERRILGAGLDCFSPEPPVGTELFSLDNTVVTPHIAGTTYDNFAHMIGRAAANSRAFVAGDGLPAEDSVYQPDDTSREPATAPGT